MYSSHLPHPDDEVECHPKVLHRFSVVLQLYIPRVMRLIAIYYSDHAAGEFLLAPCPEEGAFRHHITFCISVYQ